MTRSRHPGVEKRVPIRVLCVDHDSFILAGIAATLGLHPRLEIVGLVGDMPDALLQFERLRPDIVLTELGMPGFPGTEAVRAFIRIDPAARVIVLTSEDEGWSVRQARKAGAAELLFKSQSIDDIEDAIEAVFSGKQILDSDVHGMPRQ